MSTRRAPAFDPSRLDKDLDELLPPPQVVPTPLPQSTQSPVESPNSLAPNGYESTTSSALPSGRAARGRGGRRPAATASEPDESEEARTLAVRIPRPLYEAVVHELLAGGVERPSYAQIVGWTCEDHPEAVLAELMRESETAARVPRGRRMAADSVALTLRFQPAELTPLNRAIMQATDSRPAPVTKTAAVTAALRVAVKMGLESPGKPS